MLAYELPNPFVCGGFETHAWITWPMEVVVGCINQRHREF